MSTAIITKMEADAIASRSTGKVDWRFKLNAFPEREKPPAVETLKADETSHETNFAGITIPPGGLMFKELAGSIGVHPKTVSRWARAGKLILAFTPGGRPRILGVKP